MILEQDVELGREIVQALDANEYSIALEKDLLTGWEKISDEQNHYDLVIMEVGVQNYHAEAFLKNVHNICMKPVLLVVSHPNIVNLTKFLQIGASDYVVKPVDIQEVVIRVEIIFCRKEFDFQKGFRILKFKNLVINTRRQEVTIDGKIVPLTKKEYGILSYLVRNKNEIISRGDIFEYVWHQTYREEDSDVINTHVANLRRKLGRVSPSEKYVDTIWGYGYKMVPETNG